MTLKKPMLRPAPLYRLVLEAVLERPEGISESELLELLKKEHGIEVSRAELRQALLKLELHGFASVDHVGRDLKVWPSRSVLEAFKQNSI